MKRGFVIALLLVAVVYVAHVLTRQLHPLQREVSGTTRGTFPLDGHFHGEPLAHAGAVRLWGSWVNADDNTGSVALGPFLAPSRLRFAVSGSPGLNGNRVFVELAKTGEQHDIPLTVVGTRWALVDADLPPAWNGQPVLLCAIDASSGSGGWLGISEPLAEGKNAAFLGTLAAWLINGGLLGALGYAAWRWLAAPAWLPARWEPLAAAAVVAAAGYATFWVYFFHATAGKWFSVALLVLGVLGVLGAAKLRKVSATTRSTRDLAIVATLMTCIGALYVALLHLFPSSLDFYSLAANRFRPALPGDNGLPHVFAAALYHGNSLRDPYADWLSSDRPPLQSGWQLLTWPVFKLLGIEESTASGTAAVWLQLLWVPAAFALLRRFGLRSSRAAAWTAVLSITGFFAQHTLFTWPKLSSAAFVCGAFALWFLEKRRSENPAAFWFGGFLAGLGWLSHGGAGFSLLALAPWIAAAAVQGKWRNGMRAGIAFLILALPWTAYQKFYDPPGNRLLKWHLGGQVDKDSRGVWATVRDGYGALSGEKIREAKAVNFKRVVDGEWSLLADFSLKNSAARRDDEFFTVARAFTWWLLAFGALAIAVARRRTRARLRVAWRMHGAMLGWVGATLVIWCLLMFKAANTVVHQGSYAAMLGLFVLLSVWFELAHRRLIVVVAGLQTASFATTWMIANPVIYGPVNLLAIATAVIALAALGWLLFRAAHPSGPGLKR